MDDLISRQAAIGAIVAQTIGYTVDEIKAECDENIFNENGYLGGLKDAINAIEDMPSAQPEIIHCRECKHWKQQTNYAGAPLSFGFCESDDMWRSLYGETYEVSHIDTDDDFYCGYAERRTDEGD